MVEITRSGVCYKVNESPFYQDYAGYRFYFSSETHRRNFFEKARMKEEWLTDSMSRRFKFKVDASLMAVFQLYRQIETRGFYIVSEAGREFNSLEDINFKAVM